MCGPADFEALGSCVIRVCEVAAAGGTVYLVLAVEGGLGRLREAVGAARQTEPGSPGPAGEARDEEPRRTEGPPIPARGV
jgi:hypothetical protein